MTRSLDHELDYIKLLVAQMAADRLNDVVSPYLRLERRSHDMAMADTNLARGKPAFRLGDKQQT